METSRAKAILWIVSTRGERFNPPSIWLISDSDKPVIRTRSHGFKPLCSLMVLILSFTIKGKGTGEFYNEEVLLRNRVFSLDSRNRFDYD